MNQNTGKKTVSWREIEENDLGMPARAFLKFARKFYLIPHMFNVESLHDIVQATIPPLTSGEFEFFESYMLVKEYEKDQNFMKTSVEPLAGEPALLFHEFIFALGRIASTAVTYGDTIMEKLQVLFTEKLGFKRVEDPASKIQQEQ